jgi:hypothetical protein
VVPAVLLAWWCDLEFLAGDDGENYGYVGKSVTSYLGSSMEDIVAQGGQVQSSSSKKKSIICYSFYFCSSIGEMILSFDSGMMEVQHFHHLAGKDMTKEIKAQMRIPKITAEEAAKYLSGMDASVLTPEMCTKQYEEAWNATHQPDPINTTMITVEE